MQRFFAPFAFFSAGLAAAIMLLHFFVRPPLPDPLVRFKLEQFLKNKDEFTTLVIGSSHSYRAVKPQLLDEQLKAAGKNSRTYNLSFFGAGFFESWALLDIVLAEKPQNLSLVLLDPREAHNAAWGAHWTPRDIYWHRPAQTAEVIRYWMAHPGISNFEKVRSILSESEAFALNMLQWGRAAHYLHKDDVLHDGTQVKIIETAGFVALEWEPAREIRERKWSPSANDRVRHLQRSAVGLSNKRNRFNYAAVGQSAQKAGATLLVHRPPVADQGDLLFCSQPLCTEVEFQDRARYPHLYNADFFYDERHYNFEGATHYTRALAEKILESGVSP